MSDSGQDGPLTSSASSLGRGRTPGKTEMGRKTSPSQRGEQGGERMVTGCGSCQQTSDFLHCSEERRQVFPNPGAPTRLRKPHPSAHRQPTLLLNQWDTLGNRPSFWRHLCKSCLLPWWMLESQHWATQSRLLFTAKLISEMLFSEGCGPRAKSQCLLPPAAAGLAEHARRGAPRALKSTKVGRAGHGGKLWSQQSYRGHSSLPPCFPFLHPFPPSQLAASHFPGDRAAVRRYEGPAHGSSYRSMLPPAPTKSKTNTGTHSIHFQRLESARRNPGLCAFSLKPHEFGASSLKPASCLPGGFLKDSKVPQTKTAAWLMAHIETTNYKMINRCSKLFQERLCCQD